jgi:hypothetical protein
VTYFVTYDLEVVVLSLTYFALTLIWEVLGVFWKRSGQKKKLHPLCLWFSCFRWRVTPLSGGVKPPNPPVYRRPWSRRVAIASASFFFCPSLRK